MVVISLTTSGGRTLEKELTKISVRANDMAPAFAVVAEMFYEEEMKQFFSEGGNSGGWAPLAPSTVADKASHPEWEQTILMRDMTLYLSLTSANSQFAVKEITPHSMLIGTKDPVAAYHQTGTAQMPSRPPVEISQKMAVSMMKVLQRWIVDGW